MLFILKKVIKTFFPKPKPNYKIGNIKRHNSLVDSLTPNMVEIGNNFISAPGSIVLAHDASVYFHCNKYRIEKTVIGDNVFLGANATVMPGIVIGDNSIIGAGSVVTRDVPAGAVVCGNPARYQCSVNEYITKCENRDVLVETPKEFRKIFENEVIDNDLRLRLQKSAERHFEKKK